MCHMSHVMRHASSVTGHMSPVTCKLSLIPAAKASDPTPANSPSMHSRLVRKDQKTEKMSKRKKSLKQQKHSDISDTLFDQMFLVHPEAGFPDVDRLQADRQTDPLVSVT